MNEKRSQSFADLLAEAVREPGMVSEAYSRFHSYSIGNAFAAAWQLTSRGIPLGPIATYKRWSELGRQVRRGEKAITLCMPLTMKREREQDGERKEECFTRFVWRPFWFAVAQTDGETMPELPSLPEWDAATALATLQVERTEFTHPDGNCQGFARARQVAVSPVAENPLKTLVHEIAHVILGHTAVSECSDEGTLTHSEREIEAEGTAYLVLATLGSDELAKSRGYIQHYLRGAAIAERSAARIFKAADQILKAGRGAES